MDEFKDTTKMQSVDGAVLTFAVPKPNYCISFHRTDQYGFGSGSRVGSLDFNGPEMKFEGEANESAQIFFDHLAKVFSQRLREEYDRGYEDAKKLLGLQK